MQIKFRNENLKQVLPNNCKIVTSKTFQLKKLLIITWRDVVQSWCRGVYTVIINGLSLLHFHMNILYLKVTGYPLIKFVDAKL